MLRYSELLTIDTFEGRLEYLQLDALPGDHTFGVLRKLNQKFYNSPLWKQTRQSIIARDLGYDLAIPGRSIYGRVLVHHLNPIRPQDIYYSVEKVIDPENLITVSFDTHNAIHFGSSIEAPVIFSERTPGDTNLWEKL